MSQPTDTTTARSCPICGEPAQSLWQPFCSKRCADVDLHRWLSGSYAVPVAENEREAEASKDVERET